MSTEIQAGDHVGKYEVLEVMEDFWRPGEHHLICADSDEVHEDARVWVLKGD